MSTTCPIQVDEHTTIFVEVEDLSSGEESVLLKALAETPRVPLPEDAEETTAASKLLGTVQKLRNSLQGVFRMIHSSMKDSSPDEWGAELTIGFKGKTNPIPVFVSGEANAAIKIHAKWIKSSKDS